MLHRSDVLAPFGTKIPLLRVSGDPSLAVRVWVYTSVLRYSLLPMYLLYIEPQSKRQSILLGTLSP
jgi:hypothetical protein